MGVPIRRTAGTVTSAMAISLLSSSTMGDNEGDDISGEDVGKDARDTSSADNGIIDSDGDKESVVISVNGSFDAGASSSSGGEKRRLGSFAVSARDVSGIVVVAPEKLRRSFSPSCHLRTPPLALALARRARETALRPKDTNPSRGLTPFDLVPVL